MLYTSQNSKYRYNNYMENLTLIGTIALVHLLALISPGPDFILAVRNSLAYSRKTGIYTAIGFAIGIAVHIAYSVAGLALIISKSILIFNAIKFLGAGYLIYIGIKSFFSKKSDILPIQALKMGFLTNILNPKATLLFLSLFTFIVKPETPAYVLITASAIMIINTALWFSLVSIFFTQKRVQNIFNKFQGTFNKIFGGLLVALGIKIALTEK